MAHVLPPKAFGAFADLEIVRSKTPVRGGGFLRKRWRAPDGSLFEWDYQHGRLEKYNKRGRHLGEYDPETGEQTKVADPSRSIEP